jgi:hypothetical protein
MTAGFNYYRALLDDAALAASFEDRKLDMPILAIGGRYGVGTKLADGLRKQAANLTAVIAEDKKAERRAATCPLWVISDVRNRPGAVCFTANSRHWMAGFMSKRPSLRGLDYS